MADVIQLSQGTGKYGYRVYDATGRLLFEEDTDKLLVQGFIQGAVGNNNYQKPLYLVHGTLITIEQGHENQIE